MKKKDAVIIISAIFSCAVMAVVDGIIMPGYIIKSIVKIHYKKVFFCGF